MRSPQALDAVRAVLDGGAARGVEMHLTAGVERSFLARIEPVSMTAPPGTTALLILMELTGLRRAERMRSDFIANVSHELRTPLASIVGFVETLRGPARDDAEARFRFLDIMDQQAQRMSRLVADLLSLSKIEQTEHIAPTGRIDLSVVLAAAKAMLDIAAKQKGMGLELRLPISLPNILGETDELVQVFQNLIDNAIKYGRAGTTVTIEAARAENLPASFPLPPNQEAGVRAQAAAVAVTNHGDGIAPEHLPRLTERFYRVDVARSRHVGGTGLGLAIVKHIVSRHRGTLAIDSAVGVGTTFTVFLPLAPSE
ncbi:MAG: hypothetical protein FJX52_15310 [Alphaproteobacteria bacterium]|nr:hypothetical protein [Alphaproteobacteria bacterium]